VKILQKGLRATFFGSHCIQTTEWSRKNCTQFNAPSFFNRLQ